ncbi:MAG: hypothetical protein Tsb0021_17270 [Chlamydiales bacterium]
MENISNYKALSVSQESDFADDVSVSSQIDQTFKTLKPHLIIRDLITEELVKATKCSKPLGMGRNKEVYEITVDQIVTLTLLKNAGVNTTTFQTDRIALSRFKFENCIDEGEINNKNLDDLLRDLKSIQTADSLKNKGGFPILGTFKDEAKNEVFTVSPIAEHGSLETYLNSFIEKPEEFQNSLHDIIKKSLTSVAKIEDAGYVDYDVHLSNFLVFGDDAQIRKSDFDLGFWKSEEVPNYQAIPTRPLEKPVDKLLKKEGNDEKWMAYSMGIQLYNIVNWLNPEKKAPIFPKAPSLDQGFDEEEVKQKIDRFCSFKEDLRNVDFSSMPSIYRVIIKGLIHPDPTARLSVNEALNLLRLSAKTEKVRFIDQQLQDLSNQGYKPQTHIKQKMLQLRQEKERVQRMIQHFNEHTLPKLEDKLDQANITFAEKENLNTVREKAFGILQKEYQKKESSSVSSKDSSSNQASVEEGSEDNGYADDGVSGDEDGTSNSQDEIGNDYSEV